MFWADRIAEEIEKTNAAKKATKEKPLVIRDEKTLSGRVHIGSMRGVAIHGLLSEVLAEKGIPNIYQYELNDFDPFDTVPGYLDEETYKPYLGMPLYKVPSPEPGFANYAEYFGAEYIAVHKKAGFFPEYYRATENYLSGKMDPYIKIAIERAADIRRVLKEVSGSVKNESWLPVSIICENCGKMMTTRSTDYDSATETVGYTCDISPDDTVPCGHAGRVSPYGGNTKLFWKADWAAKWIVMGVHVEGGGKDHSTKGGSRDVANHIAREVFNHEPPFDVPYEFFLVGGKKMSSSKGKGSSAKDMAELFTPQLLRLILIGKDINQQIDVDPEGDSIPRNYDWYDDLAERVREGIADDFTRLFALTQLPEDQADAAAIWQLRFSQVAFMVQMPHLSLAREAQAVKAKELQLENTRAPEESNAALTPEETAALFERAEYAKFWLATYAPEQYRFVLQDTLPESAKELSIDQKQAITALHTFMAKDTGGELTGEEIQNRLFELKTEIPIAPKELFSALYNIFLDRDSGPKLGWFLSVLPRDFVLNRLKEASV